MDYVTLLEKTALAAGNCACLGIDPNFGALPDGLDVRSFFLELFEEIEKKGIALAAVKPNIGYFSKLDRPLEGDFRGSMALADIVKALPARPFILDAKRGDIATSSANYAFEAFRCWRADCVTVSPYMGNDSISPFASAIGEDTPTMLQVQNRVTYVSLVLIVCRRCVNECTLKHIGAL